MKSLKIAALGVAALGFAAAPAFGAFAETPTATTNHIDHITINVEASCTLGTIDENGQYASDDATTHEDGDELAITRETTTYGTNNGIWDDDTLTASMLPGTVADNLGTTTLTVRCNDVDGYDLYAVGTDLVKSGDIKIPAAAATTGESYWTFMLESEDMDVIEAYDEATGAPTTEAKVASSKANVVGNLAGGDEITATYGAGIAKDQESGSYTGTITYRLAQL